MVASSIPRVVRPGEHGAFSTPGDATAARDSPALGSWDFRDVVFADPPQCRGQAVRIRPVRRLDLVGNRGRMAKITGAQSLLVGPRRRRSHFTGTVVPIGFCGDRPESHTGAGRFSTAAPIGTMGLPDLQPDAARVVSGDLSRLDVQPECRGASGLPLGLLAGLVPTLGTTLEARKLADIRCTPATCWPTRSAERTAPARPPSPR